jgi:ubiquinol-cytochrome c reductase cytochrome c subunit
MRAARRALLALAAALCGGAALLTLAGEVGGQVSGLEPSGARTTAQAAGRAAQVAAGRELFEEGCASCHGLDARGIEGVGPALHGAGAASADFYLSTGRMPLNDPGDEPVRAEPRYSEEQIDALVAYVGSLGGPPIPAVDLAEGDIQRGLEAFTTHCAGCHQVVARGGIVTGGFAPDLLEASPAQVAEAVRVGPFLMPDFPNRVIDEETLNSIAAYVEYAKDPVDEGGWGIGNIGPVPEGMVAWLLAIIALLLLSRLIGERTEGPRG